MDSVTVENLSKEFWVRSARQGLRAYWKDLVSPKRQKFKALDGVTFSLAKGERAAFIGPNGAGKSTTIKILSGILQPTSGEVRVAGLSPSRQRRALAYKIGTVFGQRSQLWFHLPALESFALLCYVYDQEPRAFQRRRNELIERFEVGAYVNKPVNQLSLGERMRCEIIASFLHAPDVIFLDEPTIGLDVAAKALIREFIKERAQRDGASLLLTSHDTGDMEQVCDRVIMINAGQVVFDGSLAELRQTYIKRKRLTVKCAEAHLEFSLAGVNMTQVKPHEFTLTIDTERVEVDQVVRLLLGQATIRDLTIEDPPLEEIVRHFYDGSRRSK